MLEQMKRVLRKEQILTIPNLLSTVRLLLIPIIVWLYNVQQLYIWTIVVILLSGVTDIVDGYIARHYNKVSDFGKILDPVADKLTQLAIIICLLSRYRLLYVLIIVFVIKEILMLLFGFIVFKKDDSVNSAKWYGKANTVILYTTMMILIMFPGIPHLAANILISVSGIMIIVSFILYIQFYNRLLAKNKNEQSYV